MVRKREISLALPHPVCLPLLLQVPSDVCLNMNKNQENHYVHITILDNSWCTVLVA